MRAIMYPISPTIVNSRCTLRAIPRVLRSNFEKRLSVEDGPLRTSRSLSRRVISEPPRMKCLSGSGAIPVHGNPLAFQLVRQQVGVAYVPQGGVMGQIDRLRHPVVRILLKRRLHPNMPPGRYVKSRHKGPSHIRRNARHVANRPGSRYISHETACVEPSVARGLLEKRVLLEQPRPLCYVSEIR